MKLLDRILASLLILGGIGHTLGSVAAYRTEPLTLLWALCASLFGFLLAAVHFIRIARPGDRPIALLAFAGSLCWLAVILAFGVLIHSLLDPRVSIQAVIALALCIMSLRSARL